VPLSVCSSQANDLPTIFTGTPMLVSFQSGKGEP